MNRHFFVGFNRDKTVVQTDGSFVRLLANVQLVAAYAHAAALRTFLPRGAEHNNFQLSNRELEVLRWASEGKTAWETGQILSIAEATATNHLKSAVRRLECVNKTQAVAKAISIGLLQSCGIAHGLSNDS